MTFVSVLVMVSKVVSERGEVAFSGIIHVITMISSSLRSFNFVASVHREEETEDRTVFVITSISLSLVFGVMSSHHVRLGFTSINIHVVGIGHSRVRL